MAMSRADAMKRGTTQGAAREAAHEVERLRPRLYRIALSITAHPDLASDACQEACLQLLRHQANWARAESPEAYARAVVVRFALRMLERSRKSAPLSPELQGPVLDETGVAVAQVLARLKADHRAILALDVGEGLSDREIAEALGIPMGTIASRLSAARAAFRAAWEDR